MSQNIDYSKGIYDARQLGAGRMLILGVQHMFAMFGATVLVPLLTGLSVSTTLLCAGLGTLLFHFITKGKVPAFLGSSFAYLGGFSIVAPMLADADGNLTIANTRMLPYACAGVGQHPGVGDGQIAVGVSQHGSHDGEAAQISKGRAEEGRDLALGDKVEQQRTQTCAEQGGRNAQTGEQGDQHGGTEHGEHVLDAQDQHPSGTQLAGIVNALGIIDILTHYFLLLSAAQKKRHYRGKAAMPQKSGPNRKRKIQPMHAKDDFFFSIPLSPFLSFFGIV